MRIPKIAVLLSFILVFSLGCEKLNFLKPKQVSKEKPQAPIVRGTIIAKVNNLPITLEELNKEIDIYNASVELLDLPDEAKKQAKIDTREKKIDYLKSFVIRQLVFYQAALDRGLDRKEDISEILQRTRMAILAQEMQREIIKNIDVGSTEIEETYKKIKDRLKEPQMRRIREIVTKTEAEANQILIELLQGADFATLAKDRSLAESAKNGGDLGFLRIGQRGEQFSNFDEIAFSPALQTGARSGVFNGPEGYYIIKIEGIKEGKQLSLNDVRDRLKEELLLNKQKEELDKFYSQFSREAKIEIYEGEIK
jgi:parvulin-like peptidyl-prolyl isomerase